jgi:multiple sugar transport system permease protein/sn-glycerol 3-phosphate transport system permease protein
MQVFQSVDIMTGGGPFDATRVMVMWIYDVAFKQFKIGRSSTLVVIFFTIIVALSFIQYFISKKKVYYEG